jgi:hypothetical protein
MKPSMMRKEELQEERMVSTLGNYAEVVQYRVSGF